MTSQPTPPEPIYDGLVGEHGDVLAAARQAARELQQHSYVQPAPHGTENPGPADQSTTGPSGAAPPPTGESLREPDTGGPSGPVAGEPVG